MTQKKLLKKQEIRKISGFKLHGVPIEEIHMSDEDYTLILKSFKDEENKLKDSNEIIKSASSPERMVNYLNRFSDSYQKLPLLLDSKNLINKKHFYIILGEVWSSFDNVAQYKNELSQILASANRDLLDLMMSSYELSEYKKLPELIKIYRGCYDDNRFGLSWTLDLKIAEEFTRHLRYSRYGESPNVLEAYIPKDFVILKLDRDELEIIVTNLDKLSCI
jgi:hypothetical protein